MSRFNKPQPKRYPTPIVSAPSMLRTYNQGAGYERDPKSELFLLAVGGFWGMDSFYEKGVARDERFKNLIHTVAKSDPEWLARFLPWLRREANMRTAAIVGAVEFAKVYKAPAIPELRGLGRTTIDNVLVRADEPGEMIGYVGRKIPKPIKRGIADAVGRLYNERNTLKYDTASHGFRFGDVLELVHASPAKPYQTHLFKYLIDRRHGRGDVREVSRLGMIDANQRIRNFVAEGNFGHLLDALWLERAGFTWEDVLSLAGDKVSKKELWEAIIPSMGYMALLRNLRNFDQAGVDTETYSAVALKLVDPDEVARSRQLPMRFLSAYRAVNNSRWLWPLEQALQLSLNNVPEFSGRTLILIDTSGSMGQAFGNDTELRMWDAAAMFGIALALRCEHADVVSFSNHTKVFPVAPGSSLLRNLEKFKTSYFLNGGTQTAEAVTKHYQGHDRVIILTDEQANRAAGGRDVLASVPHNKVAVTFNLAGHRVGHAPSGSDTRITIGGLSDQAFKLLPILEKRSKGEWPF